MIDGNDVKVSNNEVKNSKLFDSVYSSRFMSALRGLPDRGHHFIMVALGAVAGIVSALSIGFVITGGLSIFAGIGFTVLALAVFSVALWIMGLFADVWIFNDAVTCSILILLLAAGGTGGMVYMYFNNAS